MKRKFATITDSQVAANRKAKVAKRTEFASKSSEKLLIEYYMTLPSGSDVIPYQQLNKVKMNDLLEKFYLCCRTVDDDDYKASSMRTMRHNISRAVMESHNYDIIHDAEFATSNTCFSNKQKTLKETGKGAVNHHSDIPQTDLRKIVATLSPDNPVHLQLLVWFYRVAKKKAYRK